MIMYKSVDKKKIKDFQKLKCTHYALIFLLQIT